MVVLAFGLSSWRVVVVADVECLDGNWRLGSLCGRQPHANASTMKHGTNAPRQRTGSSIYTLSCETEQD